eukprot:5023816-Prorocentrum_lima.AAC.1
MGRQTSGFSDSVFEADLEDRARSVDLGLRETQSTVWLRTKWRRSRRSRRLRHASNGAIEQ